MTLTSEKSAVCDEAARQRLAVGRAAWQTQTFRRRRRELYALAQVTSPPLAVMQSLPTGRFPTLPQTRYRCGFSLVLCAWLGDCVRLVALHRQRL